MFWGTAHNHECSMSNAPILKSQFWCWSCWKLSAADICKEDHWPSFSHLSNIRNGYTTVNQLERMTWRTFSISILISFSTSTLHRTVRLGHVLKCVTTNNNAAAWLFPSSYMWYWSWRTPEHWLQSAMIRYSMDAHTEVSNLPRILVMASEHTLLLGFKWSSTVSSLLVSLQRKNAHL